MTEGYAFWLAGACSSWTTTTSGRFGRLVRDAVPLDALPSYFIKRQVHATFMWDPMAVRNRDLTGIDCLLWGNDYPHSEGSYPYSQEWVDKQFAGVPEDEIHAMTYGNASKLFGLSG